MFGHLLSLNKYASPRVRYFLCAQVVDRSSGPEELPSELAADVEQAIRDSGMSSDDFVIIGKEAAEGSAAEPAAELDPAADGPDSSSAPAGAPSDATAVAMPQQEAEPLEVPLMS